MCVILYLPKQLDKKMPFLKEAITKASEFNQDGMGYAIKKEDNTVFLSKGYFDLDEFLNALDEEDIQLNDELLIHLRIGNIGKKDASLCHPFIVSKEDEEILTITRNNIDKPILAHNGTMRKHVNAKSDNSDTFFFIKNVLSNDSVLNFLKEDPSNFNWLLQDHLNNSRLAIIFPDDNNTILLGQWHKIEGIYFSKDYYEEYCKPKTQFVWERGAWRESLFDDNLYDDFNSVDMDIITSDFNDGNAKKIYVPQLSYPRKSIRDWIGTRYVQYMGLFIPVTETVHKFLPVIDDDNYDLFHLTTIESDHEQGIYRSMEYETYGCTNVGYKVRDTFSKEVYNLNVEEFYKCFRFTSDTYTTGFYIDYFTLVSKLRLSKNLIKRLKKTLDSAKSKNLDNVTVLGIKNIELEVLEMFIINAEVELDLIKNPHKLLF